MCPLETPPFVPTRLEEEKAQDKGRTIGVWFNEEELRQLEECGAFLHQEKPATIIKQMITLGANLIDRPEMAIIRDLVFNNVRKNKRQGIEEVSPRIRKS